MVAMECGVHDRVHGEHCTRREGLAVDGPRSNPGDIMRIDRRMHVAGVTALLTLGVVIVAVLATTVPRSAKPLRRGLPAT